MKIYFRLAIFFQILLLAPKLVFAQGTLEVSNMSQSATGSLSVASDSWIAQSIITGNNPAGYTLNSVELLMNAPTGVPVGFTVSVYSILNYFPANDLGGLTGASPVTGGVYTYSTPGIFLSASTGYFVVVTDESPSSQGAYNWSATTQTETTGTDNWTIVDSYFNSANGSMWTGHDRGSVFQMALFASPVPEPSSIAIGAIGALVFGWQRCRKLAK